MTVSHTHIYAAYASTQLLLLQQPESSCVHNRFDSSTTYNDEKSRVKPQNKNGYTQVHQAFIFVAENTYLREVVHGDVKVHVTQNLGYARSITVY